MSSKLITIRTNLSDFKAPQYGYDRRGAGPRKTDASGQPYIVNSLPQKNFNVSDFGRSVGPTPNEDFLKQYLKMFLDYQICVLILNDLMVFYFLQ